MRSRIFFGLFSPLCQRQSHYFDRRNINVLLFCNEIDVNMCRGRVLYVTEVSEEDIMINIFWNKFEEKIGRKTIEWFYL